MRIAPLGRSARPLPTHNQRACLSRRCVTAEPCGRCAAGDALGLRQVFLVRLVEGGAWQHDGQARYGTRCPSRWARWWRDSRRDAPTEHWHGGGAQVRPQPPSDPQRRKEYATLLGKAKRVERSSPKQAAHLRVRALQLEDVTISAPAPTREELVLGEIDCPAIWRTASARGLVPVQLTLGAPGGSSGLPKCDATMTSTGEIPGWPVSSVAELCLGRARSTACDGHDRRPQ
jgi:hypothetical protein